MRVPLRYQVARAIVDPLRVLLYVPLQLHDLVDVDPSPRLVRCILAIDARCLTPLTLWRQPTGPRSDE